MTRTYKQAKRSATLLRDSGPVSDLKTALLLLRECLRDDGTLGKADGNSAQSLRARLLMATGIIERLLKEAKDGEHN